MKHHALLAAAGLSMLLLAGCWPDGGDDSAPAVATLTAGADTVELAPGGSANLLVNDTYNGVAASVGASGNVSFSLTTDPLPSGVAVADGMLTLAADAAPVAVSLNYQICDKADASNCSPGTVALTVLRNVAGCLVAPEPLAQASQSALVRAQSQTRMHVLATQSPQAVAAAPCADVPSSYRRLAAIDMTPLRADGSVSGATITTDAVGAFIAAVQPDVTALSIAATPVLQAATFDVADLKGPNVLASPLPVGSTYEITSLILREADKLGLAVTDSLTNKAVLSLRAGLVTAKVDGVAASIVAFAAVEDTTFSSTGLVMDASGSMATTVYTDPTTGKSFDRYALASIAGGVFVDGKQASDEVAMVIFDDAVNLVDDAFLAGLSFTNASNGAAAAVTVGSEGFTTDGGPLRTVANLYNPNSAIYERCYSSGVLLGSCFDYLSGSDTSIRLLSPYPWGGSTALWSATDVALDKVHLRTNPLKFVVAMTDGQDNASALITSATVIAKARQYGIPVWMVAFGAASSVNEGEMQKVAADTGGSYYRKEDKNIVGLFDAIQTGIRFQYTVTLGAALTSGQVVTIDVGGVTRTLTVP